VKKNLNKAEVLFKKACEVGKDSLACDNLIKMNIDRHNTDDVVKYTSISCLEFSILRSCLYLSNIYLNGAKLNELGFDFKKNPSKAQIYIKKGCDIGTTKFCELIDIN